MSRLNCSITPRRPVGTNRRNTKLVTKRSGILLDICLGGTPQPNSVVMSPTGDVKHDPRKLPFPLPDKCCHTVVVTHILEYLEPDQFFRWWDELHRIMRPGGAVYVSGPYGGDESQGWVSDPTHRTRVTEQSFAWLDPRLPFWPMHKELGRRTPKPWHTVAVARVPGAHGTISYNVTMQSQVSK